MSASAKIDWGLLPVAMPDGQLMPHLSARHRTAMVDAVFEGTGGAERLMAWANQKENYEVFITKLWAKGMAKSSSVEVSSTQSVEDLFGQLDMIEGSARDVTPAEAHQDSDD